MTTHYHALSAPDQTTHDASCQETLISRMSSNSTARTSQGDTLTSSIRQTDVPTPDPEAAACHKQTVSDHAITARTTFKSWSLELVAMALSIGSLIAIISILYRENGRPLANWSLAVSLNTVISTLGTLTRTTLAFAVSACVGQQKWTWLYRKSDRIVAFERFDEASRGPWGGTRLLVWLRARHWAALGALVIVGTVAFDPFLQAVISTYGQLDNVTGSDGAVIGQALNMAGGALVEIQTSAMFSVVTKNGTFPYVYSIHTRPDYGIVSSTYSGLHNTSAYRKEFAGFTCATGNCTWPVFTSSAVCSSCEDVSMHMKLRKGFDSANGTTMGRPRTAPYTGNWTGYHLPYTEMSNYHGFNKYTNLNGYTDHNDPRSPARTFMTLNTTVAANETIAFQNSQTLLMAFNVMRAPDEWLTAKVAWEDTRPIATECALYLCANAYRTISSDNSLDEQIIASWNGKHPDSYKVDPNTWNAGPGADTWVANYMKSLYDAKVKRTDLQLNIPPEFEPALNITRAFNISHTFIYSTIDFLQTFVGRDEFPILGWPYSGAMPLMVEGIWNSTNLTTTFDNVARSITNQIRNTSPDRHQGVLQRWTIHVRVDWAYLTFPITMLLAGMVYVTLIIVESTRLRLPVWKEKALPVMLYGFNDETQRLLREEHHDATSTMTVKYRIDEKEDCLRLVAD